MYLAEFFIFFQKSGSYMKLRRRTIHFWPENTAGGVGNPRQYRGIIFFPVLQNSWTRSRDWPTFRNVSPALPRSFLLRTTRLNVAGMTYIDFAKIDVFEFFRIWIFLFLLKKKALFQRKSYTKSMVRIRHPKFASWSRKFPGESRRCTLSDLLICSMRIF